MSLQMAQAVVDRGTSKGVDQPNVFFALSATEEEVRNPQARKLLDSLRGQRLSDVLITTDQVVLETLTLIQTTVEKNFHARAVEVGEQLSSEKLTRIYRTSFEEHLEAFPYVRR